jgi:hypothetical protein
MDGVRVGIPHRSLDLSFDVVGTVVGVGVLLPELEVVLDEPAGQIAKADVASAAESSMARANRVSSSCCSGAKRAASRV